MVEEAPEPEAAATQAQEDHKFEEITIGESLVDAKDNEEVFDFLTINSDKTPMKMTSEKQIFRGVPERDEDVKTNVGATIVASVSSGEISELGKTLRKTRGDPNDATWGAYYERKIDNCSADQEAKICMSL